MSRDNVPTTDSLDAVRALKAMDTEGALGTTARYWINRHLPALAREHFGRPGIRILDMGCGDGPNARILADAGISGSYLGIDLASSPLWPELTGHHDQLAVRFCSYDAHRIGELDEEFDGLLSVSAFEHFRDERRVLEGVARVLRPGARGIIIVPSPFGNLVWGFRHGYRTYTPDRLRRALDGTPLRLVEAIPSGALPSLTANAAWRATSLGLWYVIAAAVLARHRGDRRLAKQRTPWLMPLSTTLQYGHLRSGLGRAVHRAMNRGLLELDERIGMPPTQWVFIVERT